MVLLKQKQQHPEPGSGHGDAQAWKCATEALVALKIRAERAEQEAATARAELLTVKHNQLSTWEHHHQCEDVIAKVTLELVTLSGQQQQSIFLDTTATINSRDMNTLLFHKSDTIAAPVCCNCAAVVSLTGEPVSRCLAKTFSTIRVHHIITFGNSSQVASEIRMMDMGANLQELVCALACLRADNPKPEKEGAECDQQCTDSSSGDGAEDSRDLENPQDNRYHDVETAHP
jgi:hypothetical protein